MCELIEIKHDVIGSFHRRCNRFAIEVSVEGIQEKQYVHLHDPGRLEELLFEGNKLKLKKADNLDRKTKWDVIAAENPEKNNWILINSSYHRYIADSILKDNRLSPIKNISGIYNEVKYGKSRLDYKLKLIDGSDVWVETKGCTLLKEKICCFPDAPTDRGTRHLEHLIEIKKSGVRTAIFILVLVDAEIFEPNGVTDPKFAATFKKAVNADVEVYPIKLSFEKGIVCFKEIIPFKCFGEDI